MAGGGECGVADLADDLVEVAEGLVDALPGRRCGQVGGGLQAEPGPEKTGDDGVQQFPAALLVLGCSRGLGQAGEVKPPGGSEVADDGEGEVTGRGGDRTEADLGRERGAVLAQPDQRHPGAHRPRRRCLRVAGPVAAVGRQQARGDEGLDRVTVQLAAAASSDGWMGTSRSTPLRPSTRETAGAVTTSRSSVPLTTAR